MKKTITNLLAALSIILVPTLTVVAHAETTSPDTTTSNHDNHIKDEKSYDIEDKTSAEFKAELEARVKARKEAAQTQITAFKEMRVKAKCKASQGLINQLSEKASAAKTSRDEIYNNMTKNATKLSDRLKADNQDTTKLDANIHELTVLIDKFKTDLKDVRQNAQDLTEMDCEVDPSGFTAGLDNLRASRDLVAQDSEAIRAYIRDTLKPTLQEIRTSIGANKEVEPQESTDGTE